MPIVDTYDHRDCVRRVKELRDEIRTAEFCAKANPSDAIGYLETMLASSNELLLVRLRQVELARAFRDKASIALQQTQIDAENKRAE